MASEIEMPRLRVTYHGSMITSTAGAPHNTTLTSTGIGHTVARFFEQGGTVVDRIINSNYRGPLGPGMNIETFLGHGRARERILDELYCMNSGGLSINNYEVLLRDCHDLLKYAGTGETGSTQIATFKLILSLTTRYVGIRKLFNQPQDYKPLTSALGFGRLFNRHQASQGKVSPNFKELWSQPDEESGDYWVFYRNLAIYCLSNTQLTALVESIPPSEFAQLHPRSFLTSWNNERVERLLLSFCAYSGLGGAYDYEKICAIRYLGGYLELPTFWSTKNLKGNDVTERLFGFLSELCKTMLQLISDTEPGDDEDISITWMSVAREAIDSLASGMFSGILCLLNAMTPLPPCPHFLRECVILAVRPHMEKWYPMAFSYARQLESHIYLVALSSTNVEDDPGHNVQPTTVVEVTNSDTFQTLNNSDHTEEIHAYTNRPQDDIPTATSSINGNGPPHHQSPIQDPLPLDPRTEKEMKKLKKEEAKRIARESVEYERRKRELALHNHREQARAVMVKRQQMLREHANNIEWLNSPLPSVEAGREFGRLRNGHHPLSSTVSSLSSISFSSNHSLSV